MEAGRYADHDDTPVEDKIIVLRGATWADDQRLLEMRGDHSAPRISFLEGALEIMSPSRVAVYARARAAAAAIRWSREDAPRAVARHAGRVPRTRDAATVRLAMFASMLGVAYAVEPWAEPFDVIASMGMQLGTAIVAAAVVMALAIADAEPRPLHIAVHAGLGLVLGVLGGLVVLVTTMPLGMLWLEDWFPQTHRERFAVVLGAGLAGVAVLIHWLATRRQR